MSFSRLREGQCKMNLIQEFYNNPYFENLKETKLFLEYLKAEERKVNGLNLYGKSVLDIGCGNGRSTLILSDISGKVVGIDFSERLLDQAKEKLKCKKNVGLFLENAESMHFEDSSFDCVFMLWNTFGNLYKSRDKVLREARRVLKPNGIIFMSVFSERVLPSYLTFLENNDLGVIDYNEDYVFLKEGLVSERFNIEKLKSIFSENGFDCKIEPLTDITHWCELRTTI